MKPNRIKGKNLLDQINIQYDDPLNHTSGRRFLHWQVLKLRRERAPKFESFRKQGLPGRYLIPEFKKTSDLLHRQQTKMKNEKFAQTFIVFSFLLEISFNNIPSPVLKDAWKFHNKFTNCLSSPRPLPMRYRCNCFRITPSKTLATA